MFRACFTVNEMIMIDYVLSFIGHIACFQEYNSNEID